MCCILKYVNIAFEAQYIMQERICSSTRIVLRTLMFDGLLSIC